jgi:O-6-methylguanine DNA methyltransferase
MRAASTTVGVCKVALPAEAPEDFFRWLAATFPTAEVFESLEMNAEAVGEILSYLDGKLTEFRVPLDMHGTDFQRAVWSAVARIPFGETRSYGAVAREIGRPRACRAVGVANGANPLPPFVPCHRVIGSDGTLTGYGGGLDLKARLLRMESAIRGGQPAFVSF